MCIPKDKDDVEYPSLAHILCHHALRYIQQQAHMSFDTHSAACKQAEHILFALPIPCHIQLHLAFLTLSPHMPGLALHVSPRPYIPASISCMLPFYVLRTSFYIYIYTYNGF